MAREYGWSKRGILEDVFLDEALEYMTLIQKNRLQGYYMQAVIATNPHTKKPDKLLKHLEEQLRAFSGIMEEDGMEPGAIDKLRSILNKKTKR